MSQFSDPRYFRRQDESADSLFYAEPRFAVHIDDETIGAVTETYRHLLPPGGALLDLMSSWRSHLPEEVSYASVTGLGMNAEEMAANPQLTGHVVHDLNADPRLPFANQQFDGGCVTVSVQYLTSPVEVFRDLARVLKPGAVFVVTYSHRCFPTKAVAVWNALPVRDRSQLVAGYFREAGGWGDVYAQDNSPSAPHPVDPLFAVWAFTRG